jgi:hypothetical protein
MRQLGWRALLAGVVSLGLATSAWAGTANRDDLVDISNGMTADSVDAPAAANFAIMVQLNDVAFASGSINNGGSGSTFTGIHWNLFEPDQSKRNTNGTGGSIQQKDEVLMSIVVNGVSKVSGVVLPGCKAKIQAKAPKGSLIPPDVTQGTWSVSCNKKALGASGMTDQDLVDLQTALGKKVVGKSSLNIKGKCTGASCNNLT